MNSITLVPKSSHSAADRRSRPRLGFLGLGWIGRNRMQAIAQSGLADIAALADVLPANLAEAQKDSPKTAVTGSFDSLLKMGLDGVVIATPSALHSEQAVKALEHGLAVFCQKPLGRNALETARVIDLAQSTNRLLGVDLSYRHITCLRAVRELCRSGDLGEIYAADLVFHNAYGPDKPWFYDRRLSGGGCMIDLGIHLVDLALWNLGFPEVAGVHSHLFSQGRPIHAQSNTVEDYAAATLRLKTGASVRLACSWKLPAGCDAIIKGSFFGTRGGASFQNLEGSFYHFTAERHRGTKTEPLTCARESWGGRAAVRWARQLAESKAFAPAISELKPVAETLDAIYANA